jgi:Kef-type K+ transport system membrane component KefB
MTLYLILTIGLLFSLATFLGAFFRKLRIPAILSFFAAGFLVKEFLTPFGFEAYMPSLEALSKFGVVFLLFLVGLKINPQDIKKVGTKVLNIALLQIAFCSFVFTTSLVYFFKLSIFNALLLGTALSFSSTIVATKLIYGRGEQDTLYAKISFGILVVQDIVAVVLILFATGLSSLPSQELGLFLLQFGIKIFSAVLLVILSFKLLPLIEKAIYKSKELLFLFSLSVCLVFAASFEALHIGFELGALTAGILLAQSFYQREISSRISPIKNLFLAIYFGYLGTKLDIDFLFNYGHVLLAVSVLISWLVKPFIINFLMAFFNFSKHDGFKTSLALSQISEFTILVCFAAGFSSDTNASIVAIFIVTVAVSSLLFEHSLSLSKRIKVKWWQEKGQKEDEKYKEPQPEILLFGAHRLGYGLIPHLKKLSKDILVVDNNPDIVNKLQDEGVTCLFGDASEAEFLETLDLKKLKMLVSTVPDLDTNLFLLDFMKRKRRGKVRVFLATHQAQAKRLEKAGATYVILPYELGKNVVGSWFEKRGFEKKKWLN